MLLDILPEVGDKRGKGENLWKAIHQLKGDIICYVDADISNIHPRFVYGLVAPLIHRDEISYVKAFYDRPLNYSSGLRPSGGGRVTEILIRPLFSLFFPELSHIIQPLSGEYAARREVLEKIPFPIGYGVETSHLLDLYAMHGLETFAQTDLDRRVHRNQTTNALGKMSFGILQTFFNRLHAQGKLDRMPDLETFYRRFEVEEGKYHQLVQEVIEEERPPMIEVEGYRNRMASS